MSSSAVHLDPNEPPSPGHCPPWCTFPHGLACGEEDWLHVSEPVPLAEGVLARLIMSVDPVTGAHDGPYVLIGDTQYSPAQAKTLGASLIKLSSAAAPPP